MQARPYERAARHDRITAAVLLALGVGMAVGGFFMDRLEVRQIHPASIPGLVPMVLGGVLAGCALLLFAGASAASGDGRATEPTAEPAPGATTQADVVASLDGTASTARLLIAALWSVVYALGLVGRLPFAVATAIYIGGFVLWFGRRGERFPPPRLIIWAIAAALVSAYAIATLFEQGFLVRLP